MRTAVTAGIILLVLGATGFIINETHLQDYQNGNLARLFSLHDQMQVHVMQIIGVVQLASLVTCLAGIELLAYGAVSKNHVIPQQKSGLI